MKRLVQGGNSDSGGRVFYPFYYVLEGSLERGKENAPSEILKLFLLWMPSPTSLL